MRSRMQMWLGVGTMIASVLLGLVVTFDAPQPPGVDRWWSETVVADPGEWMVSSALALDHLGGGVVAILIVPVLVVVSLILARGWRGAVFAVATFVASTGVVQLLKSLYGRARPEDMMIASDFGSFPSGHTANAATIAVVLYLLFPRMWVVVVGAAWVLAMALSRTLVSAHWVTDTVGGALVGVSVPLVLAAWALPWARTQSMRFPRSVKDGQ